MGIQTKAKTKALLGIAALVFAFGIAALCLTPKTAFAVDADSIELQYKDGSTTSATLLSTAIRLANESEGTENPVTKLVLGPGIFTPNAPEDLTITKSNLEIMGAGQGDAEAGKGTLISTGSVSVAGQAGILVAADNVSIHDLAVHSEGGEGISALKISRPAPSDDTPLVPVLKCAVSNVTLTSDGHALNIHGATGVSVNAVTVVAAGKLGISIASATGVTIDNCTIGKTGWGKDVGIMYKDAVAYATPSEVNIGTGNTFENGVLYSERPRSADGGFDTISADGWALEMPKSKGDAWILVPVKPATPVLFKDEANVSYASFEAACEFASDGATITLQSDSDTSLVVPASASGKSLIIDGGGHTLGGGFSTDPAAALTALTVQNFMFSNTGFSSTAAIGDLSVKDNGFSTISGTAISASNLTGSISISGNTIENWAAGATGHAVDIAAADGSNPTIDVTENSFALNNFDASVGESFIQVAGTGLSGTIDLSHNYWNGLDPTAATAAQGVSIADVSGAGTATGVVLPFYSDKERTVLVNEPYPKPDPDPDQTPDAKPLPTPAAQPLAKTDDCSGLATAFSFTILLSAASICVAARYRARVSRNQ